MPELPEVETIRRVLEPQLRNRKMTDMCVLNPSVIAHPAADEFCRLLTGQVISSLSRRGKFLRISMQSGDCVLLHLRMTGGLLVTPPEFPPEKHTHLIFRLDNGMELRFADMRRFGRFWLLRNGETDTYSGIDRLGLEPFDSGLTAEYLKENFGRSRKAVKTCLLEQSVIAGIGNIYSDEILFRAKICPSAPADSLTEREWKRLAAEIPKQLQYFIDKNVISAEDYLETKGKDYRNTPFLRVYGHAGEPCPDCGERLERTVIGGRSSVFCRKCQNVSKSGYASIDRKSGL